jgi:hypothetical protein
VVQAVRFAGSSVAPVVFTPIYHADPLAAFLVPAAALAVVVPLAVPKSRPGPQLPPDSTASSARA